MTTRLCAFISKNCYENQKYQLESAFFSGAAGGGVVISKLELSIDGCLFTARAICIQILDLIVSF